MGKTRDLFKKIRDTKGTFHAKNPIFPSGYEGTLGVALESLQGLRDLT